MLDSTVLSHATLDDLSHAFNLRRIEDAVYWFIFAISVWEHILLLPQELGAWKQLLKGRWRHYRTFTIFLRYINLTYIVLLLCMTYDAPGDNCWPFYAATRIFASAVVSLGLLVFSLRIQGLLNPGEWSLRALLWFSWLTVTVLWLSRTMRAHFSPASILNLPTNPRCYAHGHNMKQLGYGSTLGGTVVLFAIGFYLHLRRRAEAATALFREVSIFAMVSGATNINALVLLYTSSDHSVAALGAPFAIAFNAVVVTRLLLASSQTRLLAHINPSLTSDDMRAKSKHRRVPVVGDSKAGPAGVVSASSSFSSLSIPAKALISVRTIQTHDESYPSLFPTPYTLQEQEAMPRAQDVFPGLMRRALHSQTSVPTFEMKGTAF